ncbi:MAG: hypothetical protein ABIH99_00175, partial [Candidatus Micrarchaeota archaeon]
VFGSNVIASSKFVLCGYKAYKDARCMEIMRTYDSSDCYYVANVEACMNCMFSFNQRSKNYLIGNLQMPKDEYAKLKENLLEDIAETIKTKKKIPSIVDIVGAVGLKEKIKPVKIEIKQASALTDIRPIENAFDETCRILLGKKLSGGIDRYGKWLSKHTGEPPKTKSVVSGRDVFVPQLEFYLPIKERFVTLEESLEFGKRKSSEEVLGKLKLSNAVEKLAEISFIAPDDVYGRVLNAIDSVSYGDGSVNIYKSAVAYRLKNVTHSLWITNSEYIFGSYVVFFSSFCINCYNSTNLTRCFEVDSSTDCNDCYFCHNCENLKDCMFCFNTKSKRYAIGNVEIGKEKYEKIKKRLLEEIAKTLENKGKIDANIFSIGCASAR